MAEGLKRNKGTTMEDPNNQFLPDFIDVPEDILPSFASIRKKTLQTLYQDGLNRDKSPKGCVDKPIQMLVNLINAHPSFATLSSCSGRIAIFDPAGEDDEESILESAERAPAAKQAGKGTGRWMLVSHETLAVDHVLESMSLIPGQDQQVHHSGNNHNITCAAAEETADTTTTNEHHQGGMLASFRFEPMLLHVAACSLSRGQQLLQLVLSLGFRESGLTVTSNRVTVAIRSYSLALAVPFATSSDNAMRMNLEYWRGLTIEANRRLQLNLQRLDTLYKMVKRTLFQETFVSYDKPSFMAAPLPNLKLWGHAILSIRASDGKSHVDDILVFGGYGTGPELPINEHLTPAPKRSDKIYRLRCRNSTDWSTSWDEVVVAEGNTDCLDHFHNLSVNKASWTAREGAECCMLADGCSVGAVFGGREGPAHPLNDLLLIVYSAETACIRFYEPRDVLGKCPVARWGHSLTALVGRADNELAALVGGRNNSMVLEDSVYVLSLISGDSENSRLQWEQLTLPSTSFGRFHHSSVYVNDTVFVFGGICEIGDLLEAFREPQFPAVAAFTISSASELLSPKGIQPVRQGLGLKVCLMDSRTTTTGGLGSCKSEHRILMSGGVTIVGLDTDSLGPLHLVKISQGGGGWDTSTEQVDVDWASVPKLGPLVHHKCVLLPPGNWPVASNTQLVSVGGGTLGMSFGPIFSSSCTMSVQVDGCNDSGSSKVQDPSPIAATRDAVTTPSDVVYVRKEHAKAVKSQLEQDLLLNKTYRMGPADPSAALLDPSAFIAIPITAAGLFVLERQYLCSDNAVPLWVSLVECTGRQVLPWRTVVYASGNMKMKR
jgi:tRNA wybutosine-synthesizing protein 3